jgi:cation diffusion facilitator CzcD-associated flavoprotein CzcO
VARDLDAVIVGAGFSGLYMLYRLRRMGLSALVLERGGGVGGTWYWNRYPGARCDIESMDYSYSFSHELEQKWEWTERYATQPEILRYLEHVADRFDLRRDIRFDTRVTAARYDQDTNRWQVTTEDGELLRGRYCVMATGNLSSVKRPDFPGLDTFEGEWHHTAEWPHEGVDFSGLRVGVIGTGSTGIQVIPQVAEQAEHLYVFQRTANFSMPAQNRPLDPEEQRRIKAKYGERRRLSRDSEPGIPVLPPERATFDVTAEERQRIYEAGWRRGGINALSGAFTDFFTDRDANETAAEFTREKIRQIVRDPGTAEALAPRLNPIGTKRTCVDIGYFETYNRDNVELVDVRRAPIVAITARGIRTSEGEFEVDSIVFAIGFDAMTGALSEIDIRGADGRRLRDRWAEGPRTYLGIACAGFPNLFMVTGPGSPSVLSNMVLSIEQHVDWIAACIASAHERGSDRIEATIEAEDAWVDHVNELADATLYPLANSWYLGANIPGKPRVFMPYVGGVGAYRRVCEEIAARDYEGFAMTAATKERTPA